MDVALLYSSKGAQVVRKKWLSVSDMLDGIMGEHTDGEKKCLPTPGTII
jgi:hypothetical protein